MKIKFCGAAQYVTGSSHLLELENGTKILLDCGMFQGKGANLWEWNNAWLFRPSEIDFLIVSHAHIDHIGRIPKLVKDGFKGQIHCTHATRSLCSVMLTDSAKIQESDIEWFNKKLLAKRKKDKASFRIPLYTVDDIPPTMALFESHAYNNWIKISNDVEILFRDAGHILGSASITLKIKEGGNTKMIGFTGDIGRPMRPIIKDPQPLPEVDYLICESTYGDKTHLTGPEQTDAFLDVIHHTCVVKKGKLIIPAFSLGRTQELVYMLDKMENAGLLPKIPVYVDSPLAVNVTTIYNLHPECFDDDINKYLLQDPNPFGFNGLKFITSVEESKKLNQTQSPCIIISASGMMNAGRIKHHLFNSIENIKNTFLIVGYCSPETPGGLLRSGVESIRIFDEEKKVNAQISIMDSFSAHGDQNEMYDIIENQKNNVKKVFLVHGEPNTQEKFKSFLTSKGFNHIEIPSKGSVYDL